MEMVIESRITKYLTRTFNKERQEAKKLFEVFKNIQKSL